MPVDFVKKYREYYMPPCRPVLVDVPRMNYIAVEDSGESDGEDDTRERAIKVLYAVAYTLSMSYLTDHRIEGFFRYEVPPLEILWRQGEGMYKGILYWIGAIRLPDFITEEDFNWAVQTAAQEKGLDTGAAKFLTMDEGMCVQMTYVGQLKDDLQEPFSHLSQMYEYARENGFDTDVINGRQVYHWIYLNDPRRTAPEKCRTVLRMGVRHK